MPVALQGIGRGFEGLKGWEKEVIDHTLFLANEGHEDHETDDLPEVFGRPSESKEVDYDVVPEVSADESDDDEGQNEREELCSELDVGIAACFRGLETYESFDGGLCGGLYDSVCHVSIKTGINFIVQKKSDGSSICGSI